MRQGFTLIQVSILLTVASIVLVNILPITRSVNTGGNASITQMNTILNAMRAYESSNASLPCPADASLPTGSSNYGIAAANPGTSTNCSGGSPAANYTDTTNNIAIGAVPVRALGLPNSAALDAWGRTITYAVDTNATVCFQGSLAGKIAVTDNGANNNTVGLLLSHGADGHGAWAPLTGTSGTASRINMGSTDTDEHLVNAHGINGGGFPANYSTISSAVATAESTTAMFVRKPMTTTFDDLVVYKSNLWTLNAEPAAASAVFPSMTSYPANGTYVTGQSLNFTMTFPQAVTVSGTPRIAITMNSGTAYATYQPGSSTSTALVFSHTVASADYAPAPTGISVTSPIATNGGSVTSNGVPACLYFTLPNLTGVLVNPSAIYAADGGGNRVEVFNMSGTYIRQIGGCSSGDCTLSYANGAFSNSSGSVDGIAIDPSGNIWVEDAGNNRIEKFNSSGSWQLTIPGGCANSSLPACPVSTANGQFYQPTYLTIDSSGNIYVSDQSNNRVQKLSSSGSFIFGIGAGYQGVGGSVGGTGTTGGKFNEPQGIKVDSSGNIWVVDYVNNRVQEFNSSGTFVLQLPCASGKCSTGSANGKLGGGPEGLAIDASGNVWVGDSGNGRIEEFNSSGSYVSKFSVSNPNDLYFDSSGNLWVASQGTFTVLEYNTSGSLLQTIGSQGTTNGQFSNPGVNNIAVGR